MISRSEPPVTFAIWAFNQEKFIRQAILGAFSQSYAKLEIILSDDCSSDATYEIMCEMAADYKGPHQVILNRNAVNLGHRGIGLHINQILQISRGNLVILAGGDDISYPDRSQRLASLWMHAGCPLGVLHSAVEVEYLLGSPGSPVHLTHGDSKFMQQSLLECVRSGGKGVLGASLGVTRSLFDRFGPLPEGTLFEDRTLAFRSFLEGSVLYCPDALVRYRQHGDNLSGNEMYHDGNRWDRWTKGLIAKYESFHADYLCSLNGKSPDTKVMRELKNGRMRAVRSRLLVSGSTIQRLLAAVTYSKDFELSDRIAFIMQRGGLSETLPYRILSILWRAKRRLLR